MIVKPVFVARSLAEPLSVISLATFVHTNPHGNVSSELQRYAVRFTGNDVAV
jgi:hypothetical protein